MDKEKIKLKNMTKEELIAIIEKDSENEDGGYNLGYYEAILNLLDVWTNCKCDDCPFFRESPVADGFGDISGGCALGDPEYYGEEAPNCWIKIVKEKTKKETAKVILEEIEGKLGRERNLYKNDEDITKGNIVIDLIEGGNIVCYIGLKRIVLLSLDLEEIKKQFGVK